MSDSAITSSQAKAIAALMSPDCHNNTDAARRAGVGLRTLQTWLASDETFKTALRDAQTAAIEHAAMRLAALADAACFQLADNLTLYTQPQHALRAAKIVLDALVKLNDHVDLAERVAQLEARSNDHKD